MRFDSYHPMINLIYFISIIIFTIKFNHPIFILIAYLSSFVYSVKLKGIKTLIFNLCLIPLVLLYAAWYSYYNHFGITSLSVNIIGNNITLESIMFGLARGMIIATIIMIFTCIFEIFSSDKLVYILGRISPKGSLYLSILFRAIPRIKEVTRRINIAQSGIGRGLNQGNILRRFINRIRICSIVVTWIIDNFIESVRSMKSRGYSLKGRTAFSIYRFDNRDRSFIITIFMCLTIILMATAFNQTSIYYNPRIVINRITPASYIFYLTYAFFFLLPMVLQIKGELKFRNKLL
ncbi:MAG: energy-coupling factor transporter transmembrane protein EcfT [Clostridium sp.]|nr:energy-coupling factor transporter transmembrane protein EcfT [Clostridium sp.]